MLKIAGSIFVITATTLAGMGRAAALRVQYRRMEELRQILYYLQSEIRYARTCLDEIFLALGRQVRPPYSEWLLSLGRTLGLREGGRFAKVWEESVERDLADCGLPGRELMRLKELGEQLGAADLEMQVKTLELYLTQLTDSMGEIQEEMKEKVKLYHCLGVLSGILIVILLV